MDLFAFDPPQIDPEDVSAIARDTYGITGATGRLRGERSHNTLITAPDGARFVLKIASASEPIATIRMHGEALAHLARRVPDLPIARMIPDLNGDLVPVLHRHGRTHAMRMVTHLTGVIYDDAPISTAGLRSIGALVGGVSAGLADFEHPSAEHFMAWDIANGLVLDDDLWAGLGPDAVDLLRPTRHRLASADELMRTLPRQVIHNDGHGGNLLHEPGCDSANGLIDFGDLVHTVVVADLAVSGANLAPHQTDPVGALGALVDGFRSARSVSPDELHALPELVLCRLALSLLLGDHQRVHAPHIAEAVTAERPRLLADLHRWLSLDVDEIRDHLRRCS